MARSTKSQKPLEFEAAMRDLEALVEKMEKGEFTLEESIKQFERGIELTRHCHAALRVAEQKVSKLSAPDDKATLEPFDLPDGD